MIYLATRMTLNQTRVYFTKWHKKMAFSLEDVSCYPNKSSFFHPLVTYFREATASCHSPTYMKGQLWSGNVIYSLSDLSAVCEYFPPSVLLQRLLRHISTGNDGKADYVALLCSDTSTPWGSGVKTLWWRVWNAPWQTGQTGGWCVQRPVYVWHAGTATFSAASL